MRYRKDTFVNRLIMLLETFSLIDRPDAFKRTEYSLIGRLGGYFVTALFALLVAKFWGTEIFSWNRFVSLLVVGLAAMEVGKFSIDFIAWIFTRAVKRVQEYERRHGL